MRRTSFEEKHWTARSKPRRYELVTNDPHALSNAGSVTVWEKEGPVMKPAEVGILLTEFGVQVTSSYKFDGEVRVTY